MGTSNVSMSRVRVIKPPSPSHSQSLLIEVIGDLESKSIRDLASNLWFCRGIRTSQGRQICILRAEIL